MNGENKSLKSYVVPLLFCFAIARFVYGVAVTMMEQGGNDKVIASLYTLLIVLIIIITFLLAGIVKMLFRKS